MATVQPAVRLLDDSILRLLPLPLREPRRAWLAILVGWALSIIGSVLLALLLQAVAPNLETPPMPHVPAWLIIFAYVVFAPVVESVAMGIVLVILLRWLSPTAAILVSVVGWASLHSMVAPAWGFTIWWPFVIFSTLFVVWRQRGFWTGVGVATLTHMLQNLGPALLIAFRPA